MEVFHEEARASLVFVDAQNDSAKQAAAVEGFVAQKVKGILISPMTVDSLVAGHPSARSSSPPA